MKIRIKKRQVLTLSIWVFLKFFAKWMITLLFPLALIWTFIECLIRQRGLSDWFKRLAIAHDQYGNVMMEKPFNLLLRKKSSDYKFGDFDETISSVIGKNHIHNELTLFGKSLRWILDYLDKDHSIKAIEFTERQHQQKEKVLNLLNNNKK